MIEFMFALLAVGIGGIVVSCLALVASIVSRFRVHRFPYEVISDQNLVMGVDEVLHLQPLSTQVED